ncbi:hypothetical protein GE09DRAFT_1082626 [Coniochaeta sp. 2T2.1]|nr:hypothetical protein GE09DRAFT_1082626 [Coniochaeta sp. 2T2.1]
MVPSFKNLAGLTIAFAAMVTASKHEDPATKLCSDGHFVGSCAYPGLKFVDTNLGMYCLNDETALFGYNWTWIDLNKCLTNSDGKLFPSSFGGYANSCNNCSVSTNAGAHLACDCLTQPGKDRTSTSIDLNTLIYNTGGAMGCCDTMGTKTWKGPQADFLLQKGHH